MLNELNEITRLLADVNVTDDPKRITYSVEKAEHTEDGHWMLTVKGTHWDGTELNEREKLSALFMVASDLSRTYSDDSIHFFTYSCEYKGNSVWTLDICNIGSVEVNEPAEENQGESAEGAENEVD